MAKGNLFLGTAARSVGDVVMYRREGSQVSRVRVRKVANPRTDAQSLQRAAFSPVAKFFSPLAVVLERAFEGVSKSRSYSEFLKVNIKKARENGWLLPKGTGFFPLPYQLTKGTLPVVSCIYGRGLEFSVPGLAADATTMGAVSTALISSGLKDGDIISIILITGTTSEGFIPYTYQFKIDANDDTTITDFFGASVVVNVTDDKLNFDSINSVTIIAGAVIVARFENDKWRRSTQTLAVAESIMTEIGTAAYKAAAVASYGNTAGDINPLVYLDGKDLDD